MRYIFLLGIFLTTTPAMADSRQAVATIGSLIAAERFCGMEYDEDMLTVWIDDRVHYTDRSFFRMLETMITQSERRQQTMRGAARRSHCQSAFNAAYRFGFLEDHTPRSTGVAHANTRTRRNTR